MSDRYADNVEIPIYSDYAAKRVKTKVVGVYPALDSALQSTITELDTRKAAFVSLLQGVHQLDADKHTGIADRHPKFIAGWNMLKRFLSHLGAHEEGSIDKTQFIRPTGTLEGIKRSPMHVAAALDWIAKSLDTQNSPVEGAATWKTRVEQAREDLKTAFALVDDAAGDRTETTPTLEAARKAWLQAYMALKLLVEAALRLAGKPVKLELYFYDMRVSEQAKVTQAPTEAEDAQVDAEAQAGEAAPEAVPAP